MLDTTGDAVGGLLLFLRDAFLHSLEFYSYGDPLPMPGLNQVQRAIADR